MVEVRHDHGIGGLEWLHTSRIRLSAQARRRCVIHRAAEELLQHQPEDLLPRLGDGGDFVIDDTGSLNGTYVNRERVGTAVLARGDEVGIGKFRLVFLTRWRLLVPPGRAHLPCEDERPLPAPALH